ncbi:type VI secretion system tube protein Hcp [Knoellia locipacati]|uniref:type VI secretion system tube protein TssD n=1 Tax=Knoellia locipacati TaxID=882824 RepID=UPI00384C8113
MRDATTGQATGKRRHSPIVVVKDVDRASPSLAWAWAFHDVLTTWRLDVFGTDQFGRRRATYSIELKRAAVVEITVTTPESAPALREAVAFGYEGITWTWHEGKTTAQDEWVAQT